MTVVRTLDFRNHKPDVRSVAFELDVSTPAVGGVKNLFERFGIHLREQQSLGDGTHRLRVNTIETPHTSAEKRIDAAFEVLSATQRAKEIRRERLNP